MTAPQAIRYRNVAVLLSTFWDAHAGEGLTASDLVERTGLTRATILTICDELLAQGWLTEDRAPRMVPGRGRQSRRFTFQQDRRLVVASDVGIRSVTSVVADLNGQVLARTHYSFEGRLWEVNRTEQFLRSLDEVLAAANAGRNRVEAVCVGVAAPVSPRGVQFPGNHFWDAVGIDVDQLREYAPDWTVSFENDANLAALAEIDVTQPDTLEASVTLLAGERFGGGIVINGELFRGPHGGAGELDYLKRVDGVRSSDGLAATTRRLLSEALDKGRSSSLRSSTGGALPSFGEIVDAADRGDSLAIEVVDEAAKRLAITISTLSDLIAPAVVIIAGGAAEVATSMLPSVRARLAELVPVPPRVVTSKLGRDVVLVGAVRSAIAQVRSAAVPSG